MNLAIIHFHLNRGGVTSVIRNHVEAAFQPGSRIDRVLLMHGPGTDGWQESPLLSENPRIDRVEIENLKYESCLGFDSTLGSTILTELSDRGFTTENTVIQIHNHCLGKNNSLLVAIRQFVLEGFKLLLQIHDFPEDLRPLNYRSITDFFARHGLPIGDYLYPMHSNVDYGLLNHRDIDIFVQTGIPQSKVHFLPNPVMVDENRSDLQCRDIRKTLGMEKDAIFLLYPVRAIRRKNITEALLFTAVNDHVHLAITLPALSENETRQYQENKSLAQKLQLPVSFEAGLSDFDFQELIGCADYLFTSSIAEGFGMVFLECWLRQKQLAGRNLKEITSDFSSMGINFSDLYDQVLIPSDWFDIEQEQARQRGLFDDVLNQYGTKVLEGLQPGIVLEPALIDFARLSHQTQMDIVVKVARDPGCKSELKKINPQFGPPTGNSEIIDSNAAVVRQKFSQKPFAERFNSVLEQVFRSDLPHSEQVKHELDSGKILSNFLQPKRFFPVRVETS